MGFFSWLDEHGIPIRNIQTKEPSKCQVLLPDGTRIFCSQYDGYGTFVDDNGVVIDFYLECARANGFGDNRDKGIDIGMEKSPEHRLPKIASWDYAGDWESLRNSPEAFCQGYF